MRSVAPDMPGSAASQNSWSVVNLKPTAGSLATTTDHTIQTAKDEQQRRDRDPEVAPGDGAARCRPRTALSSGRQSVRTRARQRADMLRLVDLLPSPGSSGSLRSAGAGDCPLHAPDGEMHPDKRTDGDQEQQHEAARPDAGEVVEHAEGDRQHEAAEAADHADEAADRADIVRVVDRDVLVDRGLAEAHEEAEHEDRHGEGDDAGLHVEAAIGPLMPCTT